MILLSRPRNETEIDPELAGKLAERFQVKVLSIPMLYDLRSFGPTVSRLRELNERSAYYAPFPIRASQNLLDHLGIGNALHEDGLAVVRSITDLSLLKTLDEVFESVAEDIEYAGIRETEYPGGLVERLDEPTVSRWYPVIDRKECIGCLECVNFCLFGVYVIGEGDRPLVDQPDACRNGCPACSRVCPGGAILFPFHADPNISGRNDAETVRSQFNSSQAEAERRQHLSSVPDELDALVEQVDKMQ